MSAPNDSNSESVVFRTRLASKLLLWLVAVAVPFQGIVAAPCSCAAELTKPTDVAEGTCRRGAASCCSRKASPPVESPVATHSCCRRADSDEQRGGCRCRPSCRCNQGDKSPRPEQLPSENRSQAVDLVLQTAARFSLECGDPELLGTQGPDPFSLCGADRCILLCRFLL